ncbi:MAG: UDP-3-O-(3-hydroxymyristoyl)glucosamine N-acyltransferase [Fimbriimonadaceae bacterium]|nr:UDP-3-O-(3-hydroxymyristoyl)glucosamine N-acyltransferase [Alphaproteobacteria bacterium]
MSEPRFFARRGPFPVTEIARLANAELRSSDYGDRDLYDVAPLDEAAAGDLTFFENSKYKDSLAISQAGAVLVAARFSHLVPTTTAALVVSDPQRVFAQMIAHFYPDSVRPGPVFSDEAGVSKAALVHPTSNLEENVTVEASAIVGARAQIGRGSIICAGAVISAGVSLGRNCSIGPGVVVSHAMIGDNVVIHAGARIGQDGFGYVMGADGHQKIPQIGRVIIQRNVEIGANSTIDRGALRDTVVGEGTKIDNLVQIAHNVVIGRHCVIAGLAGISGSCVLEDFVAIGGSAGIADHVHIGQGAQVGAASGVKDNIPAGARWAGTPARPAMERAREYFALKKLAQGKIHIKGRNSDE